MGYVKNKQSFPKLASNCLAFVCCSWMSALVAYQNADAAVGQITPPAGPRVIDWSDFFVTGDFIWWYAHQDGISYAQNGRNLSDSGDVHGHRKDVSHGFEPGFKIGTGLNFRYDGWDFYASYTWLYPKKHGDSTEVHPESGGLQSRWSVAQPDTLTALLPLTSAHADWTLYFNVLDAVMGRNFHLSPTLSMRPFMGFKAAWISQDYNVHYHVADAELDLAKVQLMIDQHCHGFGIRGGCDTAWKAGNEWYLYGSASVTALWSSFTSRRKDRSTSVTGARFISYHLHSGFDTLSPVLELGIGLQYLHDLLDGKRRFAFRIGWEEQIWFSQNRFINPQDYSSGDLTLHGLTAQFGYAW